MTIHRLAKAAPAGSPAGRNQVLCGHYLTAAHYTVNPNEVTCANCHKATTSKRTKRLNRLAKEMR